MLASNDAFLLPDGVEAAKARAAAPETVGLAEAASFMVEWHALAERTGDASYAETADHVVHLLQQRHPKQVHSSSTEPCGCSCIPLLMVGGLQREQCGAEHTLCAFHIMGLASDVHHIFLSAQNVLFALCCC